MIVSSDDCDVLMLAGCGGAAGDSVSCGDTRRLVVLQMCGAGDVTNWYC